MKFTPTSENIRTYTLTDCYRDMEARTGRWHYKLSTCLPVGIEIVLPWSTSV